MRRRKRRFESTTYVDAPIRRAQINCGYLRTPSPRFWTCAQITMRYLRTPQKIVDVTRIRARPLTSFRGRAASSNCQRAPGAMSRTQNYRRPSRFASRFLAGRYFALHSANRWSQSLCSASGVPDFTAAESGRYTACERIDCKNCCSRTRRSGSVCNSQWTQAQLSA